MHQTPCRLCVRLFPSVCTPRAATRSARFARRAVLYLATAAFLLLPNATAAQTLTGTLIATVKDAQGAIVQSATATLSSPALIGGRSAQKTNDQGQLRFFALPPGWYVLDIEAPGLTTYHEEAIRIGAAATIERIVEMTIAGIAESVTVEEPGPGIDAREPGIVTRFGPDALESTPTRRSSMFDFIRATPGVSRPRRRVARPPQCRSWVREPTRINF